MLFVRVRDKDTGHQFDVPEGDRRIGAALVLLNKPAYPPVARPRRAKHNVVPLTGAAKTKPASKKAAESKEDANHGADSQHSR